jgi:hypothetical protein
VSDALSQQLNRSLGGEYADQFLRAVSTRAGVTRNAQTIEKVKRSLSSPGPQ